MTLNTGRIIIAHVSDYIKYSAITMRADDACRQRVRKYEILDTHAVMRMRMFMLCMLERVQLLEASYYSCILISYTHTLMMI